MQVRDELPSDHEGIFAVHAAAFPSVAEAELVDRLRLAGDLAISLVAEKDNRIVGHVAFSRMRAPFPALGLAPIGVLPGLQRRGCGGTLIRAGFAHAKLGAWQGIFVLGDPAYYERFGFSRSLASGFACRYAGERFMAAALYGNALPVTGGSVAYPPAFDLLG